MNLWECGQAGCKRTVTGCGSAVGLRAIGWFFRPGSGGSGPDIFCPEHRPDPVLCNEGAERLCSICAGEAAAERVQAGLGSA